jgi:hypothetical protein
MDEIGSVTGLVSFRFADSSISADAEYMVKRGRRINLRYRYGRANNQIDMQMASQ